MPKLAPERLSALFDLPVAVDRAGKASPLYFHPDTPLQDHQVPAGRCWIIRTYALPARP